MKKTKTIFLIGCFFLLAIGGFAQKPVTIYSGVSTPARQGWNELKLDASVNSVAAPTTQTTESGVLKFTSVNAQDQFSQLGWYRNNLGLNLSKGYTVEIKAKLNTAAKGAFNIQGYDNEGKGFRLGISETQLTNQSNPLDSTTLIEGGLTNDSEFHTYRLAVAPSGIVTLYRDGATVGNFPLSAFQFDNIITNGGFEDEGFPDFSSNGTLRRISKSDNPRKVNTGDYALEMDNNGLVTNGWTNIENARTRDIAIKPNTDYELRITRRRSLMDSPCFRDGGAFYNGQRGTLDGVDERDARITWLGFDRIWQIHPQDFKTPAMDADHQSVRLEFPTWSDGDRTQNTTAFDNIILREKTNLVIGPTTEVKHGFPEVIFPDGYTNLIENGDFEDHELNNDGTPYTWTLSNEDNLNTPENEANLNTPVGDNPLWNGNVRIQKNDKPDDQLGGQWAHSGTSSLRFSTLDNNASNFDFAKELDPNKTYRFNFWHRSPTWDDWGWLKVRIGNTVIWGNELKGRNNVWANSDLIFTTTGTDYTLHIYTTSADHGGWWNLYLDDLVLYELPDAADPQIAGKTNLIANGDFEDVTIDNTGETYEWALASGREGNDDNYPVAWNDQWGSYLRIQDKQKATDTGLQWAHSGTKSLRFSFLDDWGAAESYEDTNGELPFAYRTNMNFRQELEPNKTYTFVFWVRAANYPDRGRLFIANDDIRIWDEELSTKYLNWTRQSITFSTTAASHTLRMFTEFGGWFNFYLDDLFLYEEDTYVPYEANGNSYLFFGKSQNTASADVEVEYVKIDNTGAYAPDVPLEPQPVTVQKFYIDFGQDASANGHITFGEDANGNYWNNVIAPNGAPSTLNAGYILPLLNSDNLPAPYVLETTKRWKSNGVANGGLMNPDPELLGDLAVATATEDYFFLDGDIADKGAFKLKNLDPEKAYKFYVFGCRQNDAVRGGVFSITGANTTAGYLQNSGAGIGTTITNTNDNTIYESLPVIPDANGEILFEAAIKDGGFVYISALKIEEVLDYELPVAQVPGKKFYIDFGMNNDGLDGSPTASPDANNNHWNNIGPAEGVNGPRTEDAGLTTNLVASDGTATSYVLTTGSTIQWNGVRNGSLLDPDPELLGDLAIATATHDYLFISDAQTAVLDFTGLNPARRYRFNVFGSRIADSDPGNRIGVLTINGENTAYGIHQMGGKNMLGQGIDRNDRNIFVSDLITPDADGKITFTLSRSLGMSHINVIKLEETLVTYAITYHLNGGTGDESAVYTVEEAFTLPTPTRTAYTFAGWYDNAEFTGTAVTEIPQGSEGNKAFYAKWEATAYPIIYHTNEGVAIPDGSYTIESETITLPTPTRADHTFLGWYESERFGGDPVTEIPQGSTGKKEFWAKWERVVGLDVVNAGLRLYPNPVVNGNLTIHNILTDNGKIDIYSVLGTLAGSYEVTGNTTVIDISALPVGTYLVKVNGRIAKIVKK